jgi:hypothetical protein
MLLHFGFVPWEDAHDAVPLRVAAAFPESDVAGAAALRSRGRKQHLFAQLARGRLALECVLRHAPLPSLLLAAARVCCMTAAEAAAAAADVSAAMAGPISVPNERAALKCVLSRLAHMRMRMGVNAP